MNDQVTDHQPHEIKAARKELELLYDRDDWTGEEVATHCRHIKEVRKPEFFPWNMDLKSWDEATKDIERGRHLSGGLICTRK